MNTTNKKIQISSNKNFGIVFLIIYQLVYILKENDKNIVNID